MSGADTVAPNFGIGKKTALNTLLNFTKKSDPKKNSTKIFNNKNRQKQIPPTKNPNVGYFDPKILEPVGDINANISEFLSAGTKFYLACYGKLYIKCESMTEARIKAWKRKIASGPLKLCEIPPTSEAAEENIKRAHLQVAHWKTAITGIPPSLDPTQYGYESHSIMTASGHGSILIPRPLPPGTKTAPDFIMDKIHCGCDSSHCERGSCKCNSIGCTVFCKCEAGPNCLNPLTKQIVNREDSITIDSDQDD